MKLTISPTRATAEVNGTLTRIWTGTTAAGAVIHAFIATVATNDTRAAAEIEAAIQGGTLEEGRLAFAVAPGPPDPTRDLVAEARRVAADLLAVFARHAAEAHADGGPCPHRAAAWAALLHPLGPTSGELFGLLDCLRDLDRRATARGKK